MLPIGNGVRQYRFGLQGSVLKVNHSIRPLAHGEPTGYVGLVIAGSPASASSTGASDASDADGLPIEVVEPDEGDHGVTQLGIRMEVTDLDAADAFWADAVGAERVGGGLGRYRIGTTLLLIEESPAARRAGSMQAVGFRYITIQVKDV